jgi:beta-mannanase
MTGAMPPVVMWFQDWQHGGFNFDQMDLAASRNAIPMVSWMPSGDDWSRYTLARINAGEHDAYVRQWARDAAAWGQPFFLRFAHEMNGTWYPWSPGVNGNTAAEFVAAWRRVHGLFAQEGAANAVWVWSPNVEAGPAHTPTPLAAVYPGDAYVDWVGLDGYNWGDQPGWRSFADVFGPSYEMLIRLTQKPLLIAETASGEVGGDKAAWIREAFQNALPRRFPRIRGVVWFHENKERDWRVDSSPGALAAYRAAIASHRSLRP